MQTFLPHASFMDSATDLDRLRLGKQRLENHQIIRVILGQSHGWADHPVVQMWRGHAWWLLDYQDAITTEWTDVRGYRDSMWEKTLAVYNSVPWNPSTHGQYSVPPPWLGDPKLHAMYQSVLVRKDPGHYGPLYPEADLDLELVYPLASSL